MKTKILSLVLISAGLMSCGSVTIDFGREANLTGELRLPETVTSAAVSNPQLARARAVPGEYVVRFGNDVAVQTISKQGFQVQPLSVGEKTWALVKAESLSEVQQLPGVEFAQPNYIYIKQEMIPNDPEAQPGSLNRQWYLSDDNNGIGAYNAWERRNEYINTIKVAVIDDGYTPHVDMPLDMFDLADPGCNTTTGINCLDAVDRDGIPRYQKAPNEPSSHGMAVAGIIAAKTNNGIGIAGLGFDKLRVVPVRVYSNTNETTTAVLARAINTAVTKGVKVINLSLCLTDVIDNRAVCANLGTGQTDPAIDAAILNATTRNITVVASAGNYSSPWVAYPASNPNVISVGATDENKQRLNFKVDGVDYGSNYGAGLDMVAPGGNIRTLFISDNANDNAKYGIENGTSFSAPMVSAAAGLLYSRNSALTAAQVRKMLLDSGDTPSDDSIDNAKFLRIDKAMNRDTLPYVGRVSLVKSNSTFKSTNWVPFAQNSSALPYNFTKIPTGTYTIVGEVAEEGNTGTLIYKCISTITVDRNMDQDLVVGYPGKPSGDQKCFVP